MGKIVIIYFSATGNTKIVANEIINNFRSRGFNTELIPIKNVEKIKSIDLSDKILGIGFPIYGCTYPHELFDKVIESISKQNKKIPTFLFSTLAGLGVGMPIIARKLKKKNIYTIIQQGFKCPSSGWGMFAPEGSLQNKMMHNFDKNLFIKIEKFVEETVTQLEKFQQKPFIKLGFIIPMVHIFVNINEWFEKKFLFYSLTIDKKKCTKCGLCVKKCPVGNIIKKDDGKIEIVDRDSCLFCGRCISICPKGAIFWGSHKIYSRYTKEFRDELLKKVKRAD